MDSDQADSRHGGSGLTSVWVQVSSSCLYRGRVASFVNRGGAMNPRAAKLWGAVCLVFAAWSGSVALGADAAPDLPRGEIARRGREATAFLEVGPGRSATAFCIHPSGLFVTNDHVLQGQRQGPGGGLKVVINSGTLEQKVLAAKVVQRDRVTDLALLRAEAAEGLHALPLGAADGLEELAEVVIFGFPFGRGPGFPAGPGAAADQYPSISVNRGAISSLKRRGGQLDASSSTRRSIRGTRGGRCWTPGDRSWAWSSAGSRVSSGRGSTSPSRSTCWTASSPDRRSTLRRRSRTGR